MVMNFIPKFGEAWQQMFQWVEEHKLTCNETTYEGLDNVSTAFLGLFKGDNIGKAVVRISH